MNIEQDSTEGRDKVLADYLNGDTNVDSDALQEDWNTMADYAAEEVKEEYLVDAPPMVCRWAYQTTADFYTARRQGGIVQNISLDGVLPVSSPFGATLRRNRALLGKYGNPRVVIQ